VTFIFGRIYFVGITLALTWEKFPDGQSHLTGVDAIREQHIYLQNKAGRTIIQVERLFSGRTES